VLSDRYCLIARDRRGWMWFGGDRGLDVFDGHTWRRYSQDDGLIWNDIAAKAFWADPDGSVWIGTGGGLSHLTAVEPAQDLPAPAFVSTRVANRDIVNGESVRWTLDSFTFRLACLTFRNEKSVRFRYRLTGIEQNWTETSQSEIRYPQLPPGSYQFEAAAVLDSRPIVSPIATFRFRVLPPWWRTPSFYIALAVLFLGLIFVIWIWSNRQVIARQNALKLLVKARTLELESEKAELIKAKAFLAQQAKQDFLTGLLNRGAISQVIEQEMERAQRERSSLTVVMVDLDHFKEVNDSYGHLFGDDVLREFAKRLSSNLRPYDRAGRFGGEEFLVVMPGLSQDSLDRIRNLHRQVTLDSFVVGSVSLRISCSFGVAQFRPELNTLESLLNLADKALYAAKANGRDRVETADGLN